MEPAKRTDTIGEVGGRVTDWLFTEQTAVMDHRQIGTVRFTITIKKVD
jgi:hypothetical protein